MKSDSLAGKPCLPPVLTASTVSYLEKALERGGQSSDGALGDERDGRDDRRRASSWRLTERDGSVVELVYRLKAVRDDHVRTALFTPGADSRCQLRLTLLVRHRYLETLERKSVNDPAVYVLGRRSTAGHRLLRERLGAGYKRAVRPLGSLPHLLGINDVRVRVMRGCADLGWTLRFWQQSDELGPFLAPVGLVPDGYFQVQREAGGEVRTSGFFLELERSGKSSAVLRSKLKRYRDLADSGLYQQVFGTRALQVLVVFDDAPVAPGLRVDGGLRTAQALGVTFARFAPLDRLRQLQPSEVLTAPVWRTPAMTEPVPLLMNDRNSYGEQENGR